MDTSKQIVVDLETLSIHPNACIVSIGAVLIEDMEITDTFYINVDGRTCKEAGLHIDPDTIKWWGEQSKEAQEAWQKNPVPLQEAIDKFTLWYGKESIPIWGYGANFDVVILELSLIHI